MSEPLSGYLTLAKNLSFNDELNGKSFNFGPSELLTKSVLDLVKIWLYIGLRLNGN